MRPLLLLLAGCIGCQFDASLDGKRFRCSTSDDCPSGTACDPCVKVCAAPGDDLSRFGVCLADASPPADTGDVPAPSDPGPDTSDPGSIPDADSPEPPDGGEDVDDAEEVTEDAAACPECTPPSDPCLVSVCDPDKHACVDQPAPDGSTCDDFAACTIDDACLAGLCVATPDDASCDDETSCTTDACDPTSAAADASSGCTATPDDSACSLSAPCVVSTCAPGTPASDQETGCATALASDGAPCGDGDACTVGGTCQTGVCLASGPKLYLTPLAGTKDLRAALALPDGGMLVAGSAATPDGTTDAVLVRLDALGKTVWSEPWGGAKSDSAQAMASGSDGAVFIAGESVAADGSLGVTVRRRSSSGEAKDVTLGGDGDEQLDGPGLVVIEGGLALLGTTASVGAGGNDAWLTRLDGDLATVWSTSYGAAGDDRGVALAVAGDHLIVAGTTASKGAGGDDAWLMRVGPAGSVLWERTYGGLADDAARAVAVLPDGGIALLAVTASKGPGARSGWLVRTDAQGLKLWDRTYGGESEDDVTGLAVLPGGGFAIAGARSLEANDASFWLVRTTASGATVFERDLGAPDLAEAATAVIALPSGGLALVGTSGQQGLVARTDAYGHADCDSSGPCVGLSMAACADANPCTLDLCEPAEGGCVNPPATGGCDAGLDCTVEDECADGVCAGGYARLFDRTFGGVGEESAAALAVLPGGGFIVAGDEVAASPDLRVTRTNAAGVKLWSKVYGGAKAEHLGGVAVLADGGLVLAGTTGSEGAGGLDVWLVRTDDAGAISWTQTFGGPGDDLGNAVALAADGGVVIAGSTTSGAPSEDGWLVRADVQGAKVWATPFGGAGDDVFRAVVTLPDGFAAAGRSLSTQSGDADVWLVRVGMGGDLVFDERYGATTQDDARDLLLLPDGGFLLAGFRGAAATGSTDMWVIRTDAGGKRLWDRAFGVAEVDEAATSAALVPSGGFAFAAHTQGVGTTDIQLFRTDDSGIVLWSRVLEGPGSDSPRAIAALDDGGLVVLSTSSVDVTAPPDMRLVRTDAFGNLSCEASGACVSLASCDDGDPCTGEACDPALGCASAPPPPGLCAESSACWSGDCVPAGTCNDGWCVVPAGMFVMGSPPTETCHEQDEAQHPVTLTRSLLVKETEVTQAEWQAIMKSTPSQLADCPTCAVETVSWYDAVAFANALSTAQGLSLCYADPLPGCNSDPGKPLSCSPTVSALPGCAGYRLPSEAEWEYFARAGTTTAYTTGAATNVECGPLCVAEPSLDPVGWYCANAGPEAPPQVGTKLPNVWGLRDTAGGVGEWVEDWYAVSFPASPTDPKGSATGVRTIRGGSFTEIAPHARSANRRALVPYGNDDHTGFRLVRTLH